MLEKQTLRLREKKKKKKVLLQVRNVQLLFHQGRARIRPRNASPTSRGQMRLFLHIFPLTRGSQKAAQPARGDVSYRVEFYSDVIAERGGFRFAGEFFFSRLLSLFLHNS